MTNEEMERSVEFVLKQQAQFAADMQRVSSDLQRVSSGLQKVNEWQARTEENLGTAIGLVGQIAQTQLQMAEAQKHTDKGLAETDRRLNSLIVVVERYFSNGRGNQ
jgi:type II secretory pathway component GspD/PulD (secretin)